MAIRSEQAPSPKPSTVVGLITAYHPDQAILTVIESTLTQCERVVVVDNSPGEAAEAVRTLERHQRVRVIRSGQNLGLAAALNEGMRHLGDAEFVLLLDQDSRVLPGTIEALRPLLVADPRVAIASPAPWDEEVERYVDPRTVKRPNVAEMTVVITSGMLLRVDAFRSTSGFRDEFFVDCVDQDFCLQLRTQGWRILQDKRVFLPHRLGNTQWHGEAENTWIRSTNHPTWRLYWMARNGTVLTRDYLFRFPGWAVMNGILMAYVAAMIVLHEPPRFVRLRVFIRGGVDGLFGLRRTRYLPSGAAEARSGASA